MRLTVVMTTLLLAGCGERPTLQAGESCSFSSDCAEPLVCRLERCRRECSRSRDCDIDSICLLDKDGLGVCQTQDERECMLNSDCSEPLVCRFGHCTNACITDDDCADGTRCGSDGDGLACVDSGEPPCLRHSDCRADEICAVDGRCREQCQEDRDCGPGTHCVGEPGARMCAPDDAGLPAHAGQVDAGPAGDGGPDASG